MEPLLLLVTACMLLAEAQQVSIPGLQPVPTNLQPRSLNNTQGSLGDPQSIPQQANCPVPTVVRADFSASQVAFLVSELQQVLSEGCYSVVSTSLATCLPDFSLSSGCCTSGCGRALTLAISPECLGQLWTYLCSNGTYYAPYVSAVVKRCVPPDAPLPADLTCPVNTTLLTELLNLGAANITGGVTTGPNADQRDMIYYAECAAEAPRLWPDFNGSLLFDSLLAFSLDVPQDCLRQSLSYLPSCYDDLTYESGCCSLRCRAAVEKVPVPCFITFQRSLCTRIPALTKFFFNAAQRCANITLTCAGFNTPAAGIINDLSGGVSGLGSGGNAADSVSASGGSGGNSSTPARALPIVASQTGQCPLSQVPWPAYNAVTVTSATLRLLEGASPTCQPQIARINTACGAELGVQVGCCSNPCALTMRAVPENCHAEFEQLLCQNPEVAKYSLALADRCLGSGFYQCTGQQAGSVTVAGSAAANGTAGP